MSGIVRERKGFVFYRSFSESAKALPENEQLSFLWAIINYALDNTKPNEEDFGTISRVLWKAVKPYIETDRRKYENGLKGAEFGKLGGAPEGNQNARKYERTDVGGESIKPISTVFKKSAPPTAEDIKACIASKKGRFDDLAVYADNFVSYYKSRGWRLKTGEPMNDWWRCFQAFCKQQ